MRLASADSTAFCLVTGSFLTSARILRDSAVPRTVRVVHSFIVQPEKALLSLLPTLNLVMRLLASVLPETVVMGPSCFFVAGWLMWFSNAPRQRLPILVC